MCDSVWFKHNITFKIVIDFLSSCVLKYYIFQFCCSAANRIDLYHLAALVIAIKKFEDAVVSVCQTSDIIDNVDILLSIDVRNEL